MLLADVDTEVAGERTVRTASDLTALDGRGGTDMREAIAWADSLRPRPSAVVVLTDGTTPWLARRTRVPVIACILGDGLTRDQARHSLYGPAPGHITVVAVDTTGLRTRDGTA